MEERISVYRRNVGVIKKWEETIAMPKKKELALQTISHKVKVNLVKDSDYLPEPPKNVATAGIREINEEIKTLLLKKYLHRNLTQRIMSIIKERTERCTIKTQILLLDIVWKVVKEDAFRALAAVGYDAVLLTDENNLTAETALNNPEVAKKQELERNYLAQMLADSEQCTKIIKSCDRFYNIFLIKNNL